MATLETQLHSEIDKIESLQDRARQIVDEVIKENFRAVVDATQSIPVAMRELGGLVEERLTDLTTEAFRTGLQFPKERRNTDG